MAREPSPSVRPQSRSSELSLPFPGLQPPTLNNTDPFKRGGVPRRKLAMGTFVVPASVMDFTFLKISSKTKHLTSQDPTFLAFICYPLKQFILAISFIPKIYSRPTLGSCFKQQVLSFSCQRTDHKGVHVDCSFISTGVAAERFPARMLSCMEAAEQGGAQVGERWPSTSSTRSCRSPTWPRSPGSG